MKQLWSIALAGGLLLTGCGGGKGTAVAPQGAGELPVGTPTATPSVAACPVVNRPRFAWPSPLLADLPQPPGATYTSTTTQGQLTVVRFTTARSLRDSVLFVVHALPAGGYALGRGDAEPAEADAPFVKGDVRGVMKMLVIGPCTTQWLVAATRAPLPGRGSPLLPTPTHPPGSTPTPLPFG